MDNAQENPKPLPRIDMLRVVTLQLFRVPLRHLVRKGNTTPNGLYERNSQCSGMTENYIV